MSAHPVEPERRVIPRWRSFNRSTKHAELHALGAAEQVANTYLPKLRKDAHDSQDPWVYADLLSALLASRADPIELEDAATQLAELANDPTLNEFARATLSRLATPATTAAPASTEDDPRAEAITHVARARRLLSDRPRDAITRVDLALAHTILGNRTTARREMLSALQTASDNRFVVRSAATLFVTLDEPDIGHRALTRDRLHLIDPWVSASALALAEIAGQRPDVRQARELLAMGRFTDHEVSELASELATLEIQGGRRKQSQALFTRSLVAPNENALAQAAWAIEAINIDVPTPSFQKSDAHEARHREFMREADWDGAVREGLRWQSDQPFSRDAGLATSYVAAVGAEDFSNALRAAELALMANPHDSMLLNNAAFAAASLGDVQTARARLERAGEGDGADEANVILATRGIIAFRSGDVSTGRRQYRDAAKGFFDARLFEQGAMALCLWGLEEARSGSAVANEVFRTAQKAVERAPSADNRAVLARLEATQADS